MKFFTSMSKKKRIVAFLLTLTLCLTTLLGVRATSLNVNAAPKSSSYTTRMGVDVSQYQGYINWSKMKAAGVEFALIRVGIRDTYSGVINEDTNYATNIQGALNAGIRVGVYIFSQATSTAEAVEEAEFLINRVYKYNITLPLVIDYEFNSKAGDNGRLKKAGLSASAGTAVVNAFCDRVTKAGYTGMVYANRNFAYQHLQPSAITNNYHMWLAHYTSASNYTGYYDFWQYSSKASGAAYGASSTYIDVDYWYDDGTIYGADYSSVFDPNYYASAYPDVVASVGNSTSALLQHFVNTGMKSGLVGSASFNPVSYRNEYADLRAAYGTDWKKYYQHYMSHGVSEGRQGTGYEDNMVGGATVYNGVDYSAVFNAGYYAAHNPDVVASVGYDDTALLKNFVKSGMSEGRQGSAEFNVANYKARYADLVATFGDNNISYYNHYISSGKAEGRSGL